MPLLDRALTWYAAARGILTPDASPGAAPPPLVPAAAKGVADLLRGITAYRKQAPVEPAWEAQRLATLHAEPSVRTFLRWTPSDLTAALHQADAGNLRMAADLCEAILGDDRASAVLNTRANAVLGSDLTFEAGRGRSKNKAVKALEVGEDWYAAWTEAALGQMLVWGRLLGVAPAQHLWREVEDHDGRLIPVVEPWHARHLRKDPTGSWWMRVGESLDEVPARPGDGKWIIFTPYGTSRPWAHGLWRGFARLWLLKQYAIDDWGKHSEAHGNPMKVGIPPKAGDGANHGNKKLRQELAQELAELGANSTLVLPPGFDFKLVEAQANTWEMFKAQIDMANNAMSVMAIGTNLPTEVGGAAATGATAQNLVRIDYKRADAEALSTMAHDQNLCWWAKFNFGDAGLAPWPLWAVVPPHDIKAEVDVLKTFAEAVDKLTEANIPADVPALAERFGVPLRVVPEAQVKSPRIFEYHLKYGILTKNEIRGSLGYDPEQGGDVVPEPIVQVPGTKPIAEKTNEAAAASAFEPSVDLAALAEANNAAHADPARQTTWEALRAVWDRGAALATGDDRDAWAMGRVTAFLHLLASGEPEHPAYVADNDLLPERHERAVRVAALGSPRQPRDDHGRWTDGAGGQGSGTPGAATDGGGSGPARASTTQRTKTHERLERSERQAAEKAERRAADLEERAKLSEGKATSARERAGAARKKADELETVAWDRERKLEDAEDALETAKSERIATDKHRSDVVEYKRLSGEADRAFNAADRRAEHLEGEADELQFSAWSFRERANEAADVAKARREHADMMSAPTDQYASAVTNRHARAQVERDDAAKKEKLFKEELNRLHEDRRVAIDEAGELIYSKDPTVRSSPAAEAALAREKAADERWEAAFESSDSVSHATERAARLERYWRDAARKAQAAVHDGPIDGDGDGELNEDDDEDDDD
ncbi:phage portal protein family protein [Sorangium sp. So ce388]|uniref:phage portal protein family protein n=1 Tax=Sorangium sp. So ce388 TaxID=3133309 RepID=UPI003F5B3B92